LLSYDNIIWGATYPTYMQELKSLHDTAISTIFNYHFQEETKPYWYYSQQNTLQINDVYTYDLLNLYFAA